MVKIGVISVHGTDRSTYYKITTLGRIFSNVDANLYIETESDRRYGPTNYNIDLFLNFTNTVFSADELAKLELATKNLIARSKAVSPTIEYKELRRLIIELSWKSSKIEGNTYAPRYRKTHSRSQRSVRS